MKEKKFVDGSYTTARSLISKQEELEILNERKLDIVGLTNHPTRFQYNLDIKSTIWILKLLVITH